MFRGYWPRGKGSEDVDGGAHRRPPWPWDAAVFHMWPMVLGALALKALALTFRETVAADRQRGLHVGDPNVIRLAEHPQAGLSHDVAFPKSSPSICAFALEEAVEVWDLSGKPRVAATVTPVVLHDPFQRTGRARRRPLALGDGAGWQQATMTTES